jgi:hypothetical protein
VEKELFDDLIESCKEVIEYQKGNLKLKETVMEVPYEEIQFYSVYGKLSEPNKIKLMNYANDLLQA